ncbi:enoyl-CoA hydratase/isomerase family protein, partial [Rhodococcus sp. 7Tela_A2]
PPGVRLPVGGRGRGRALANDSSASIKRVMNGATPAEAVDAFARLWVADAHWEAAEKVMNRAR